ncbi:MAG TPA: PAS domain S-box protein [Methanoregulaceae archaeon]|nr:PAS domain S-box protein [Methanoregulaceae archaeon]HPD76070.1 PAS domain S-box protein [Methanoregulaceae archaeon]
MAAPIHAFLVDNDPGLLDMTRGFLEESGGFRITTSTSAGEALAHPACQSCDVIVSGHRTPGIDGIAFLKRVRQQSGDLPFILFTGNSGEEVLIDAINNGADYFLRKGADPSTQLADLAQVIRQAVARSEAWRSRPSPKRKGGPDGAGRRGDEKYQDLADLLPQAVFELDPDFRVTYVNRYARSTFGITDGELAEGISGLDFIDPADHRRLKENVRRHLQGTPGEPEAYTAIRRDGRLFPVIIYAVPVFQGPVLTGYRGVMVDITARKAIEDDLRESERKFRSIFENSPYPVAINSFPDNEFLEVNKAFLDVSGYTPEEVYGKNPVEMGLLSYTDAAKLVARRVLSGKIENVPLALTAKEGRRVHVIFSSMPISINNIPATITVTAEVTKLRRIEEELIGKNAELNTAYEELARINAELRQQYNELSRKEDVLKESEEKFRALVELALDGILIADFSGTVLFANRATGLIVDIPEYKTIPGKNVFTFIAPESRNDVLTDVSKVSQGIDAYLTLYKIITANNREIWVECIGKKIAFGEGSAILVSLRDVTDRKKAEEAVRESENRFATVFRSNPVAMTLVSATDGVFIDVNDAFVQNTGYSREETVGTVAEKLGLFADNDEHRKFVSSLRDQRTIHGMEIRCRTKSGIVRTCLFSSGIIMMSGKPHILSSVEDITERKTTEAAIQAIIQSMVGTTGLNSLRKITESVSSWLSAECVIVGEIQPDNQTVTALSMILDGKDVRGFSYALKGTPCENVAMKGYCLYPDKAQDLFPQSRDITDLKMRAYTGTPLRDSRGNVIGILCALSRKPFKPSPTMREILDVIATKAAAEVERIRIERDLWQSRRMLVEAMDLAQLVNWEYDTVRGMFTFDDRFYSLYGTTVEREGAQMSAAAYEREFIPPEEQGIVTREIAKAEAAADPGYVSRLEHRIVRRDGKVRNIVVNIGITKDAEGRTVKTHGANQDVTDRKRAEEAIRRANLQLNLLGRITRHDIVNKISIILGYLRIAEMKFPDPELIGLLKKIEDNTGMIRSQIEFTRVYRDLGTHEPQWLELAGIFSRLQAPEGITLVTDSGEWSVFADPMLPKVFENLLDNSVRHGEKVTEIRVSAAPSATSLVILWEDNGVGIPREMKERIFEQGVGKNTGLGMFLTKEILSLTGISIGETGEPGTGARFEITVPKDMFRAVRES